MRIQPISANQQTIFYANPKPNRTFQEVMKSLPKRESTQERNYLQAIMLGLAFIVASFTKYFIDIFETKHKEPTVVEIPATKTEEPTDMAVFQVK